MPLARALQPALEIRGAGFTDARFGVEVRDGNRLLRAEHDGREREDDARVPQRGAAPVRVGEGGAP